MADSAGAAADAGICIFCVSALSAFCFLKPYGAGSSTSAPCGGPRGCCGSCLDKESGEDSFERAQRKEHERRMKKEANTQEEREKQHHEGNENGVVDSQPMSTGGMQASPPPPLPPPAPAS